jgi:hypothetical protein
MTDERLFEIVASEAGDTLIAFRLYDRHGDLVADSDGLHTYLEGKEIRDKDNELLLLIPPSAEGQIEYRLYSRTGTLLTCSDGGRTQLFGGIKLEAIKPAVKPPFTPSGPRAASLTSATKALTDKRQRDSTPSDTRTPL